MSSQDNHDVKSPIDFVLEGNFVHSTQSESMRLMEDMAIGVRAGKIVFFDDAKNLTALLEEFEMTSVEIRRLTGHQFVIPGFVDTHAHAAQYSYMGTGYELELLPWLDKYTYPTESRIASDEDFARDVYTRCVNRTLKCGTTTICYYATIDTQTTLALVDAVEKQGQRAFIGKVNMDMNSPEHYIESTSDSMLETRRFVEEVLRRKNSLVTPCLTPRFAVSCTADLMKQLSTLAKEFSLPVQTHISENLQEISLVKVEFPMCENYSSVYDTFGLLTDKTILAHGIYLSDQELDLIAARGSGISHCPNSNFCICSGVLDVRRLLDFKVKVGLGTDFAGGHSPSMLDAIRGGMNASNVIALRMRDEGLPVAQISFKDMFMLATLGSSRVMGLEDTIGNFQVGKDFDALVVDPEVTDSPLDVFPTDSLEDIVQKFFYVGDDRNIIHVFVHGRRVAGHTPQTLGSAGEVTATKMG